MSQRLPDDWFPRDLPAGLEIGPRSFLVSSYAFKQLVLFDDEVARRSDWPLGGPAHSS